MKTISKLIISGSLVMGLCVLGLPLMAGADDRDDEEMIRDTARGAAKGAIIGGIAGDAGKGAAAGAIGSAIFGGLRRQRR